MVQGKLPVEPRNAQLVTRLLENPRLPAYIPTLSSPDLTRLVRYIGKEDAQELLVYATAEQIRDLIEADTWTAVGPGHEETFAPERFLEWLELWSGLGAELLTSRLEEMGSQLLALTLDCYLVVVDIHEVGVTGQLETFDRFGVMPRDEEQWPLLLELLINIWNESSVFLEESLAYCCQRRSLTVEKTHITSNENLEPDVAGERDRHRRERGFVTPTSALAFLSRSREKSLQQLVVERELDPATAMQLRHYRTDSSYQVTSPANKSREDSAGSQSPVTGPEQYKAGQRELEQLLAPVFSTQDTVSRLLPDAPGVDAGLYLDEQLSRLGADQPDAMRARAGEILYLANVLMEGLTLQGDRLSESDAMQCVSRTCNLGLTYCVFHVPWDDEAAMVREILQQQPGLVRVFNIGFRLISELPFRIGEALHAALCNDRTQRRLSRESGLREAINKSLDSLLAHRQDPQRVPRLLAVVLDNLTLPGDASTCEQLRIIGDTLPRFPSSLTPGRQPGTYVDRSWRFIATSEELQLLTGFFDTLESRLFG